MSYMMYIAHLMQVQHVYACLVTLTNPVQVIGMHFMNPVPVMKLVEVDGWAIDGHGWVIDRAMDASCNVCVRCAACSILLNQSILGYVTITDITHTAPESSLPLN